MATAAGRLLQHMGASVQHVLGTGQFGTVVLVSQQPPPSTTTTASHHHPVAPRLYAAKVVLLATRKRRRSSSRNGDWSGRSNNSVTGNRSRSTSLTSAGGNVSTGRLSFNSNGIDDENDRTSSPVPVLPSPLSDVYYDSGTSSRSNGSTAGRATEEQDPAVASLFREIDMLQSLRPDPTCHVVQYIGTKRNHECIALLYEYMAGGSVKDLLEKEGPLFPLVGIAAAVADGSGGRDGGRDEGSGRKDEGSGGRWEGNRNGNRNGQQGGRLSNKRKTSSGGGRLESYTRQMLSGVSWLHENGVCHRDIKCSNLLLSTDQELLKLSDFGQIKWVHHSNSARGISGSPLWLAPEVIKDQVDRAKDPATAYMKADVWSLGCTVVEMVTGKTPWDSVVNSIPQALYRIATSQSPPPMPGCQGDRGNQKDGEHQDGEHQDAQQGEDLMVVQSFVNACCDQNSAKRPAPSVLLQHYWLEPTTPHNKAVQRLIEQHHNGGGGGVGGGNGGSTHSFAPIQYRTTTTTGTTDATTNHTSDAASTTATNRHFALPNDIYFDETEEVDHHSQEDQDEDSSEIDSDEEGKRLVSHVYGVACVWVSHV